MNDLNSVAVYQRKIKGTMIKKWWGKWKRKKKTCTSKMLLSCGKQHGNEGARICDLSTPQQARTAVQFIGGS